LVNAAWAAKEDVVEGCIMARTGFFNWGSSSKSQASTAEKQTPREDAKPRQLPPYNVVLFNDEEHTYEYVIQMLRAVFSYSEERGYQLAKEVDNSGRAVLMTTHRELAELKREQVIAYGSDIRIAECKGSMSAIIEPAA
jgi:ATP-dependent Clp protease adaptor protein ClpS